jgi:parallel beta-helix repeat protein
MKPTSFLFALSFLAISAAANAGVIHVEPGADAQERLQAALIEAKPGDTVEIAAGRFDLTDGLSLDVDKVTVKGAGPSATILSFKGQKGSGEGLLVTADDVVLKGFAVEDSRGDGIKSKGANRIAYVDIRVEWVGGPLESNGAYGIYPVESSDVLIDRVTVRGASDAGIYVGQSNRIIVRNSTAMYNVAGIEIENSFNADVYGNVSMHNTGGILVFDLPSLPQLGGHNVRVFGNRVTKNDTSNFAPKGNIVASVPDGTGILVMANRDVQVFNNAIGDNITSNVMIVGYQSAFTDTKYNPLSRNISVYDNAMGRSGWKPDFPGGDALAAAVGGSIPAVLWDGTGQNIRVTGAGVLSLGLKKPADSPASGTLGQPDLSKGPKIRALPKIILPAALEAASR